MSILPSVTCSGVGNPHLSGIILRRNMVIIIIFMSIDMNDNILHHLYFVREQSCISDFYARGKEA